MHIPCWAWRLGAQGSLGFGDTMVPNITPIMENQMEKKMENENYLVLHEGFRGMVSLSDHYFTTSSMSRQQLVVDFTRWPANCAFALGAGPSSGFKNTLVFARLLRTALT